MVAVTYPSTLPGPSLSAVTPADRALRSDVTGGPLQLRGIQRDYLGTQRAEWELTAADAAVFDAWWATTLRQGGAWFAATWPGPQGWVQLVRRFTGVPQWSHQAGGFWRVSAQLQVRGRGMPPDADPLWGNVVLLVQGGTLVDRSKYRRTLTPIGGVSSRAVAGFPSGQSVRVLGDPQTCGVSWFFNATSTPELRYGSLPVCIEMFFRYGAAGAYGQYLYSDSSGALGAAGSGINLTLEVTSGYGMGLGLNAVSASPAFIGLPWAAATVYHVALQVIPGASATLYVNGVGTAGSLASFPSVINDPLSPADPPSFGHKSNIGANNEDLDIDQYRITAGVARYTADFTAPTVPFPSH